MVHTLLHFGAGALGRGLILPLLANQTTHICIADTNTAVVDKIRSEGGYPIAVFDRGRRGDEFIPISRAFALGRDDHALDIYLREVNLVTTSVQVGNLPDVVRRLARIWRSSPKRRTVIGCENLRKVGGFIEALFRAENVELSDRIFAPDCVVDRICSASPPDLLVETEYYTEWVIEASINTDIPGPNIAADVDRLFFRKRYLVNTLADAVAFIGIRKGHSLLHEAVSDRAILREVSPLLALLRSHLVRVFAFDQKEIMDYQDLSLERLSNPSISRRLETVARDPWRKFGPTERFMEPLLAESDAGRDVTAAVQTMRSIIANVEPERATASSLLSSSWGTWVTNPLFGKLIDECGAR